MRDNVEPSPEDVPHPAAADWGDLLRERAAITSQLADNLDEITASWSAVHKQGMAFMAARGIEPPGVPMPNFTAPAQHCRLLSQVTAAQALAYDELMAAGGPDNPEARSDYEQASAFHTALLASEAPPEPLIE